MVGEASMVIADSESTAIPYADQASGNPYARAQCTGKDCPECADEPSGTVILGFILVCLGFAAIIGGHSDDPPRPTPPPGPERSASENQLTFN